MASAVTDLRVAHLLCLLSSLGCEANRVPRVAPPRATQPAGEAPAPVALASPTRVPVAAPRLVLQRPELGDAAELLELRTSGRASTCLVDGEPRSCRVGDLRAKVENRAIPIEPRIALLPPLTFAGELAFAGVTTSQYSHLEAVDATPGEQLGIYLVAYHAFARVDQVRHGDAIAAELQARAASHAASRCRSDARENFRDHCRYFVNATLTRDGAPSETALEGIADCAISTIDSAEGPPFHCELVMVVGEDRQVWLRAVAGFGRYTDDTNHLFMEPGPGIRIFLPHAAAMAAALHADGAPTRVRQDILDAYRRDESAAVLRAAAAVRTALADSPLRLKLRDQTWQRQIWTFGIDPGNPSEVFANGLRSNAEVRVIARSLSDCEDAPVAWPKQTRNSEHVCVGLMIDSMLTVSNRNTDRDKDWRRPSPREAAIYDQAILDSLRSAIGRGFAECTWATGSDLLCTR